MTELPETAAAPDGALQLGAPGGALQAGAPDSALQAAAADSADHLGAPDSALQAAAADSALQAAAPDSALQAGAPDSADHLGAPGSADHLGAPGSADHLGAAGSADHLGAPGSADHLGAADDANHLGAADSANYLGGAERDDAPAPYSSEVMRRVIEATVMVSADPLPAAEIAALVGLDEALVAQACRDLANDYEDEGRGFQLAEVAGGWRYQSHPSMAPVVEHMVREGQNARLSPAALETLAIVAYKQPISRAQVSSIRGVNVEAALRSLVARGLVDEVGRDPGPGQAILYGTTSLFLERLGLASVAELPPVADFVPGPEVVDALEQGLRPLVD